MARKKNEKSLFDYARDELFSHIHRCGVLHGSEEQQVEWMKDTVEFMAERYPDLSRAELRTLSDLGLRFCKPVIGHGEAFASVEPSEDATAA